jgi:hypothetical protein
VREAPRKGRKRWERARTRRENVEDWKLRRMKEEDNRPADIGKRFGICEGRDRIAP